MGKDLEEILLSGGTTWKLQDLELGSYADNYSIPERLGSGRFSGLILTKTSFCVPGTPPA